MSLQSLPVDHLLLCSIPAASLSDHQQKHQRRTTDRIIVWLVAHSWHVRDTDIVACAAMVQMDQYFTDLETGMWYGIFKRHQQAIKTITVQWKSNGVDSPGLNTNIFTEHAST